MNEGMSLARQKAHSYRATLDEVWDHIDRDEEYEGENPTDFLDTMPLEIVWEIGEPFAVVLGTGGPHTEITGGGRRGGYTLHVYWGGDHAELHGESITRTGEYFRELYEAGDM